MGGIKTKSTGSLAFFSSAGHARRASLAEQPWFLSSILFCRCSLLQHFVRSSVSVRFCCTVTLLTAETRHMISAKEQALMKPTATLVNIARGGIVNHDDLTDALKNGVIKDAALDVTEPKLLLRDHPLLKWQTLLWHHTLDQQLH